MFEEEDLIDDDLPDSHVALKELRDVRQMLGRQANDERWFLALLKNRREKRQSSSQTKSPRLKLETISSQPKRKSFSLNPVPEMKQSPRVRSISNVEQTAMGFANVLNQSVRFSAWRRRSMFSGCADDSVVPRHGNESLAEEVSSTVLESSVSESELLMEFHRPSAPFFVDSRCRSNSSGDRDYQLSSHSNSVESVGASDCIAEALNHERFLRKNPQQIPSNLPQIFVSGTPRTSLDGGPDIAIPSVRRMDFIRPGARSAPILEDEAILNQRLESCFLVQGEDDEEHSYSDDPIDHHCNSTAASHTALTPPTEKIDEKRQRCNEFAPDLETNELVERVASHRTLNMSPATSSLCSTCAGTAAQIGSPRSAFSRTRTSSRVETLFNVLARER